ncbi:lipopolysaccharide kinase InaA family protein [Nonlabens sp. YIK11]|uniref:lipopolysaccharide kinase InaA family protein n=1 Tax=Nonlabens sp. YIK11 TaxID=1453349 RepID=UPI001E53FC79|nr:lipopolysaccharide kinase InaA family protein [Nonlabens sp. YIK11]
MHIKLERIMRSEIFVSSTLSRKQFQNILELFHESNRKLGDDRNEIKIVEFENRRLVVKSFKVPNIVNQIAYRFFRKSKAERSYLNAIYLKNNGIGTPEPVAYLEQRRAVGFYKSYYVSEYASHDFTFRELIHDDSIENKIEILESFTQFVYRMHEAQIYFLDNSPGNTLISINETSYKFYLVDLNRMKFYDIPVEDRLKNFERLSPQKWMYEIMGAKYAELAGLDEDQTIQTMWHHAEKFRQYFQNKKRLKKKFKKFI